MWQEDSLNEEGIDCEETFAPVGRYKTIRSLISIVATMGWNILNGANYEEVYIEQPHGFEVHGKETHVYKLKKPLYGLKQALEHGMLE